MNVCNGFVTVFEFVYCFVLYVCGLFLGVMFLMCVVTNFADTNQKHNIFVVLLSNLHTKYFKFETIHRILWN